MSTRPKSAKIPKIKWEVAPAPSGQYRSFEERCWPSAEFVMPDGTTYAAVRLHCEQEYNPGKVKTGNHPPIKIYVAVHSKTSFEWRALKKTFPTLDEAKEAAFTAIVSYQEFWPEALKPKVELAVPVAPKPRVKRAPVKPKNI